MKKIFTLLIFAGFLSSASFAQDGHRGDYANQENSGYRAGNYSQNYDRQYAPAERENGGYRENRQWNYGRNENDYGNRDNRREYWHRDRNDEWNREGREGYGNYYPVRRRQVIFSDPECNSGSGAWFQVQLGR